MAHETKPLEGFGLFGVIKETAVDDEGLLEFSTFFPETLYRDDGLVFYKALDGWKLSMMGMLWGMVWNRTETKAMGARLKEKELEGNFKGEGLTPGGFVIFDRRGDPKYSYLEETGKDIVVADLVSAVRAVRVAQES